MQFVLDCVTTALTAILCFFMLFHKYEFKKNIGIRITIISLVCVLKMALTFFQIPILNFISGFLLILLIVYISYRCERITAFIYSLLFSAIALVSDVLGVLIVSAFCRNTILETLGATNLVWHHHIWNWILQIFFFRIVALLIRTKNNIRIQWQEIIFYIIFFLFQCTLFVYTSSAVQAYVSGQFIIYMMLGFLGLDVYLVYILNKISSARDAQRRMNLMQQQEILQLQMYQELQKKYNETCGIAHDIHRHIASLTALIEQAPNTQAKQYLDDLTMDVNKLNPTIKNQNAILEIILTTASERCKNENIPFDLHVEDFPVQFISDMDMTTIFSNLLDNAIDASLEMPKSQRRIHLVFRKQMGLIVLRITNHCRDQKNHKVEIYHSSKPHHSGIGLSNVRKAVEKYDGIMCVHQEESQFAVSITFLDR